MSDEEIFNAGREYSAGKDGSFSFLYRDYSDFLANYEKPKKMIQSMKVTQELIEANPGVDFSHIADVTAENLSMFFNIPANSGIRTVPYIF